jgi:CRP-like cAMP-binding protein
MIAIMLTALSDRLSQLPSSARTFAPGEALFRQGDPVEVLHFVRSGEAHLVRLTPDGQELILQRAQAGDLLAEASAWSDCYHCGAVAFAAPVRTLAIARGPLRAALASDAALAEAFARHLASAMQRTRLRAEILTLRTVAERLDAWLAAGSGALPVRGEGARVAAEIGVSPEALYREIARRRNTVA